MALVYDPALGGMMGMMTAERRIPPGELELLDAYWRAANYHGYPEAKSLAAVDAVSRVLPKVPRVACFDTTFHATLPQEAATYAVRRGWREQSHAYAARAAGDARRVVTCHLGAGASLCAVLDGRSVETTMGFTPLEGLVMATRSGSVDPGLLLWLQQHQGVSVGDMARQTRAVLGTRGGSV